MTGYLSHKGELHVKLKTRPGHKRKEKSPYSDWSSFSISGSNTMQKSTKRIGNYSP